jgi:hypothetical protein
MRSLLLLRLRIACTRWGLIAARLRHFILVIIRRLLSFVLFGRIRDLRRRFLLENGLRLVGRFYRGYFVVVKDSFDFVGSGSEDVLQRRKVRKRRMEYCIDRFCQSDKQLAFGRAGDEERRIFLAKERTRGIFSESRSSAVQI